MMCFRDTTFCSSPGCQGNCGRQWTDQLQREADRWWGKPGAPVAFADFCGPLDSSAPDGARTGPDTG